MFNDKKLLVTGGTGSIGNSICNYFNNNGCKEIFSTTTNLNKVKSHQDYIKFKELNLDNIENLDLEETFDFDVDFLVLNAGLNRDNIFLRMSSQDWNSVINVNLNSSFYLLKHFVRKWLRKIWKNCIYFISSCSYWKSWLSKLYSFKSCYFWHSKIISFGTIIKKYYC